MFIDDLLIYINRPLVMFLLLTAVFGFFAQFWLSWVCLKLKKSRTRLSPILQINIFLWLLYAFAVMLWQIYLFAIIDYMQRSVYALFFIGIFMTASGHTLSISITFLMVERVLIISRSSFHQRHQTYIVKLALLACGSLFVFILTNTTIREMPLQPLKQCQTFFCIMTNGSNFINSSMKVVICGINVCVSFFFLSILFVYSRKGKQSTNGRFKTANLLVVFAIISEVSFVILPRLTELSCTQITWFICPTPFMAITIQLNTLCTGIIYLVILRPKRNKNVSIATITVIPPTQTSFKQ